jgi:DNA-binding LytR/AlgR family response regulator
MNIRVLIVEDEQALALRLAGMINEIKPDWEIVARTESIEETRQWLNINLLPDLMFLDIHLADGSAFDLLEQTQCKAPVIFTTAYDEYALKAFKVNSIDYLLKPVKKSELQHALEKFLLQNNNQSVDLKLLAGLLQDRNPAPSFLSRLMVKTGMQIRSFAIDDVAYFYIAEKVVFAKLSNGDRIAIDLSLDQLEQKINPKRFFRINRAFIISYESIDKMYAYSKSRIKVTLKPSCEIDSVSSTEKSPLFRDWLSGQNL